MTHSTSRESHPAREEWMSDDQWRCAKVASELKAGFHHIDNLERCGSGVRFYESNELATFDFDLMTRAVVLAHKYAVRIGVSAQEVSFEFEGNSFTETRLIVTLHPRKHDGEKAWQRHPTLDDLCALVKDAQPNKDNPHAD